MANISTSKNCIVNFSDEEKEILKKASEICNKIGNEIWKNGTTDETDEISYFFTGIGGSIENSLKGNYWRS